MRRILITMLLFAAPTGAQTTGDLFRAGRFAEAATAGVQEATPAALVLAARSLLVAAAYQAPKRAQALDLIGQAIRTADQALAKQPNAPDALLQKAIALGYAAKLERSPAKARQARRLMEDARGLAPDNALAWAALAGWHGEALATLGSFIAGTVLGADRTVFERSFDRALVLDPANPVYPTLYAFTLLALDSGKADKAAELLARAERLTPRDDFEALIKAHAGQVLPLLRAREMSAARARAARLLPFGAMA